MSLLARFGLRGLDRLSLLTCRRSIGLRSLHLVPSGGDMETPINPPRGSPAAASTAAVGPRWEMLRLYGRPSDSAADSKTVAECQTSTGKQLRVSFGLASPPASSFLYYDLAAGSSPDDEHTDEEGPNIMAAHGNSVLLEIISRTDDLSCTFDYFVYRAAGATRPPSLSLLPACDYRSKFETEARAGRWLSPREQALLKETTGLLRRGDDELLVVSLDVTYKDCAPRDTAGLCVFRLGGREWEFKEAVPIVLEEGSKGDELYQWRLSESVVAVGDRFLCWVNYLCGFLLCDMVEASPKLRYVPLPVRPHKSRGCSCCEPEPDGQNFRNMYAAGTDAVRFVSVDPRCCCGGPGTSTCVHSQSAFTVTSWTLSLSMDKPMTWVKDGVLDCAELWAQPGYEGLPRVQVQCPVVSLDNPDIICFKVSEECFINYKDRKVWMLEVDMKRKAIISVVPCTDGAWSFHIPTKLHG
ncbi:hypothetical protein ACP70R_014992 [Stipagrostis hirtigluma subsp. patula]